MAWAFGVGYYSDSDGGKLQGKPPPVWEVL